MNSFADLTAQRRLPQNSFYNQMNLLLDWDQIREVLNKYYTKGLSAVGEKPYDGMVLLKMLLIGTWKNLSDLALEHHVRDSNSASFFCCLSLEDNVPDHSTISRFRTMLVSNNGIEPIMNEINRQLEIKGLIVNKAVMVDATITQSPRKPKGKVQYEIAQDRKEDERPIEEKQKEKNIQKLIKVKQPGVDGEARWLKKGHTTLYGYKATKAVDKNGMIRAVCTASANVHDSQELPKIVEKLECIDNQIQEVYTDKGYNIPKNKVLLMEKKMKNRIQYKAVRNKPLTSWQVQFNKLISKKRWVVERTFGSIKKWFGGQTARYVGIEKMHFQHVLQSIAHNLKRSPGLVCQLSK